MCHVQDQLVTETYSFFAREGELSQVLLSVSHKTFLTTTAAFCDASQQLVLLLL